VVTVDDELVDVGAGLHLPFKAVPNPHQWEAGVLVVTAVVVVDGGGLHLPSKAVPNPQ